MVPVAPQQSGRGVLGVRIEPHKGVGHRAGVVVAKSDVESNIEGNLVWRYISKEEIQNGCVGIVHSTIYPISTAPIMYWF